MPRVWGKMYRNLYLFSFMLIYFVDERLLYCSASSSHLPHCNYTIDRIDAITNFANGTLFVSSGSYYWLLNDSEKPTHENAKNLTLLLPGFTKLDAVVNVGIKSDKKSGKCVKINERIIFYSQVTLYENIVYSIKTHS